MINLSVMAGSKAGTVPLKVSKFPCGESNISVDFSKTPLTIVYDQVNISLNFKGNSDLIDLLLVVDAVKRTEVVYKSLVLLVTYFPYGRQDRVCNNGEPHSLRVVCDLINSCSFDRVFVIDPHSDVIGGLINNVRIVDQTEVFLGSKTKLISSQDYLVSPDAGAYKKVSKTAREFQKEVVRADKIRDTKTGEITSTEVYAQDLTSKSVLILDDIADGGRSFTELAKKLREKGAQKITLYVTHGMFTKGVKSLLEHVDEIWCYEYNGTQDEAGLVNIVDFMGGD